MMSTASQQLSDPGLRSTDDDAVLCDPCLKSAYAALSAPDVRCLSPYADPRVPWDPQPIALQSLAGVGLVHQGQLVLSLEAASDLGCIPSSHCVLGAPRPEGPPCLLWHGAALCRLQKLFCCGKRATRKSFTQKWWCQLQSLLTVTQSVLNGKHKLLVEHDPKLWTPISPGERSHSFSNSRNLPRMLSVYKRSEVNGWKSLSIKSIKYKAPLRSCLSQRLLAVERIFRGNTTLCFPVPILFPKHLLLATG